MKKIVSLIKPKSGFSQIAHIFFTALIPFLVYAFVQWRVIPAALAVILLSKWRMLAVRPRHWWPNIRANGVDLVVGISVLAFMTQTSSGLIQVLLATAYGLWLLFLKPRSDMFYVSIQAFTAQTAGITALLMTWSDQPTVVLVALSGIICYVSARHFFTSFDEPHAPLFSHSWGYFGASMAWILSHWMLFYSSLAQQALLLSVIGFGLAALYYLEQTDRLSTLIRRQFVFIMVAIVVVVLVFSEWGDKAT